MPCSCTEQMRINQTTDAALTPQSVSSGIPKQYFDRQMRVKQTTAGALTKPKRRSTAQLELPQTCFTAPAMLQGHVHSLQAQASEQHIAQ